MHGGSSAKTYPQHHSVGRPWLEQTHFLPRSTSVVGRAPNAEPAFPRVERGLGYVGSSGRSEAGPREYAYGMTLSSRPSSDIIASGLPWSPIRKPRRVPFSFRSAPALSSDGLVRSRMLHRRKPVSVSEPMLDGRGPEAIAATMWGSRRVFSAFLFRT